MKLRFFVCLVVTILLGGCNDWTVEPVHIYSVEIPGSIDLGQYIIFRMKCETPDPCYKFSHLEVRDNDFDVWVKVFAKRDPKVLCIQILGEIDTSGRFKPDSRGDYHFHFWQKYDSEYLDKTVVVK